MLKNISHNNQKKIALINDFTGFGSTGDADHTSYLPKNDQKKYRG